MALAYCQPTVRGLLLFHVSDENDLGRWQSGVYYTNGKAKASLGAVRAAIAAAHAGSIATCGATIGLNAAASVRRVATSDGRLRALVRCDLTCDFRLRLERVATGSPTVVVPGQAVGGVAKTVDVTRAVRPGRYRFAVIAWAHTNTAARRHGLCRLPFIVR